MSISLNLRLGKYRRQVVGILLILVCGTFLYFQNALQHHEQSPEDLLIAEIKTYLIPPSDKPYNLTPADPKANTRWHDEVSTYVEEILKGKKSGFFIECGAHDGEFLSNTLRFEKDYGWNGLLVEADPVPFRVLKKVRNRKAWLANVCLGSELKRQTIVMRRHNFWPGMSYNPEFTKDGSRPDKYYNASFVAQCFPLATILAALEVTEVDYFSLDVEGAEIDILKSFPFNTGPVVIKVISVEVQSQKGVAEELKAVMAAHKFRLGKYIVKPPYTHDFVFIHESVST